MKLDILLIEDNPQDVFMTKRALKKQNLTHKLEIAVDGEEAINILNRALSKKNNYNDIYKLPQIIFLDLNLPKVDGFEVLQFIKNNPTTKHIPVIVLSTTERLEDVSKCYQLGANTVLQKPIEFDRFMDMMLILHNYWSYFASLEKNLPSFIS